MTELKFPEGDIAFNAFDWFAPVEGEDFDDAPTPDEPPEREQYVEETLRDANWIKKVALERTGRKDVEYDWPQG